MRMSSKAKATAVKKNGETELKPGLRFPEFRDAGGWEEMEVGKVFNVTRGEVLSMTLVQDEKSSESFYPVYSSRTKNNGLSGYYSDYLYENAITWTTDGANAGDVNFRVGKFYCTNVCGVLINTDGYANFCVAALINSVSRKYVSYVGNPKLMNGIMANIPIPFPPVEEQQKIADCLTSIDELIAAQTRKMDALKTHKKGLMQNFFRRKNETQPGLRFPEFRDAEGWKEKRLVDLCSKITQGGTPDTSKPEYWGGSINWLTPAEMGKTENYSIHSTNRTITESGLNNCSSYLLPKHSVILSTRAPIGHLAINTSPMAINQGCKGLIPSNALNLYFLYYSLIDSKSRLIDLGAGNTFKELSGSALKNFEIWLPSLAEQQKIADCLTSVDELIAAQARKVDALKTHKKGLMQQLFPSLKDIDA